MSLRLLEVRGWRLRNAEFGMRKIKAKSRAQRAELKEKVKDRGLEAGKDGR